MGTRIRYDTFFSTRPNPSGFLAMRHFLLSALLLSLVAGCSSGYISTHRIDVQQGNALDQENISRLKPGLNRSQVRFLLGTPLVVDPFRTDRWDYVYMFYKAGKLTEQKRISLFFDNDTLVRIEGDLPESMPQPAPPSAVPKPESQAVPAAVLQAAEPASVAPTPVVAPPTTPAASQVEPAAQSAAQGSSIVAPLPSPKDAPAYVDPRPSAEPSLQAETDAAKTQPNLAQAVPESNSAPAGMEASVLKSLNDWAAAWERRDKAAYFAAYDDRFVPKDGISRVEWEKRKRTVLDTAKSIDLKIDSPLVDRTEEGTVRVTFKQFYHSDRYSDAVVKQLHMVERDGRWLIVEERVLSVLPGGKP